MIRNLRITHCALRTTFNLQLVTFNLQPMTHIFLYGPPGTGKSTIGKLLAQNLRLPFIDLDRVIETNAGMSISQIMERQGESAFRDMEISALKSLTPNPSPQGRGESVVALGGGALLRDENRAFAESNGSILLLMAELPTLLERMKKESGKRPLLAGDLKAKLTALLEKRSGHYNSFPLKLHVDGKSAEQNAHEAQIKLGRHHLSAMGEYDVVVGHAFSVTDLQNPIIVTDENVAKFHLEKIQTLFNAKSVIVPAGEEHKNLATV
ncbi:MAG: shikimate kinase, partial [Anaerolineales bacterium]|nr:shikimate kinase [Anaerolineales bacterium]